VRARFKQLYLGNIQNYTHVHTNFFPQNNWYYPVPKYWYFLLDHSVQSHFLNALYNKPQKLTNKIFDARNNKLPPFLFVIDVVSLNAHPSYSSSTPLPVTKHLAPVLSPCSALVVMSRTGASRPIVENSRNWILVSGNRGEASGYTASHLIQAQKRFQATIHFPLTRVTLFLSATSRFSRLALTFSVVCSIRESVQ
jgi:hypothetical protein